MMVLLHQEVLLRSIRRHVETKKWLEAWAKTAQQAAWENLDDVRVDYPSADGVKLKSQVVVTVFNVKGNEYRLLTNINFTRQIVVILELLTHTEYSKNLWKRRY